MIYDQILHACTSEQEKVFMRNTLLKGLLITHRFLKKNEQYIFQDGGGGHLRFMYEQYTSKLRRMLEITFSYNIHKDKWYYIFALSRKVKKYMLLDDSSGYLGFMHEQDLKLKQ